MRIGNQAVTPIGLTPSVASGVSKVYDGTAAMNGLTMGLTGRLAGDTVLVNATGTFATKNAGSNLGYDIDNVALSGADAGNYYLTSGAFSGTNGVITPAALTLTANASTKTYDGTTSSAVAPTLAGRYGLGLGDRDL